MNNNPTELAFQAIVSEHVRQFPAMQLDDLYKLIFQAAMGSEHAAVEPDAALHQLMAEADRLMPNPEAALFMPLSPDHRLVRVGLGPYLMAGGRLHDMAQAFVRTAALFSPSIDQLATYGSWAEAMAARGELPFTFATLEGYIRKQRSRDYPAVHHSAHYLRLYRPAYRVVLKELIRLPQA